MAAVAKKYNAPAQLYLSHSTDKLRNPLSYDSKVYWVDKAFGSKVDVVKSEERTIFEILKRLSTEGYTDVIYVGGGDRIGGEEDISQQILRYNGTPGKNGEIPYSFNSIKFVNAGNRNDYSDDITERASASAARAAVVNGNFDGFKELVPFNEKDADNLFRQLYNIMVEEELSEDLNNIKGYELTEDLLNEDAHISIGNRSFPIKFSSGSYNITMGDERFYDDFVKVFNGDPINIEIPNVIDNDVFDNYDVVEGSKGSHGRHGRIILRDENGKEIIKLNAVMGNVKGQSTGQFTEALVCYYYNKGLNAPLPQFDGQEIELTSDWKESIEKTVKLMKSKWPSGFTAVQVDGLDFSQVDPNALEISKIYKDKKLAGNIIMGDIYAFSDLYSGGKDNWSKADILLIKDPSNTLNTFKTVETCDALNNLIRRFSQNNVIPISLKMIPRGKEPTIEYIVPATPSTKVEGEVKIQLPGKIQADSANCSCYLISEDKKVQFRSQVGSDALSIEVLYGSARGGKPLSNLKKELGINNSFYQFKINNEKELLYELGNIVGNENIIGTVKNDWPNDWYNRVCFRGLIGLHREYLEKFGRQRSPQDFMAWIYKAATTTPTPFWIIR